MTHDNTHDNIAPIHDNYSLSEQAAYEQGRTDQKVECLLHGRTAPAPEPFEALVRKAVYTQEYSRTEITRAEDSLHELELEMANTVNPKDGDTVMARIAESKANRAGMLYGLVTKERELEYISIPAILVAHQAALAARDAEWVAAIEELKGECRTYETVILKSDAVENLDALLAKFKGGK